MTDVCNHSNSIEICRIYKTTQNEEKQKPNSRNPVSKHRDRCEFGNTLLLCGINNTTTVINESIVQHHPLDTVADAINNNEDNNNRLYRQILGDNDDDDNEHFVKATTFTTHMEAFQYFILEHYGYPVFQTMLQTWYNGQLPIHVALTSCSSSHNNYCGKVQTISILYEGYAESIFIPDKSSISNRSTRLLLPFMLAGLKEHSYIDTTFFLIRKFVQDRNLYDIPLILQSWS